MPLHYHGQRRRLYPPDAQHLPLRLRKAYGVEPRGVHAQQPVADGAAEARLVEALVLVLRFEVRKGLADGVLRQARHPQPLHRALRPRFLHDPSLDELSLLPGIAAVDDAVGGLHQTLDGVELLLVTLVVDEFDAEPWRYHGQAAEGPPAPLVAVVLRLLQAAQVAERPRHLVPVALHVAVVRRIRTQHLGNFPRNRRFLSNTNNHNACRFFILNSSFLIPAPTTPRGSSFDGRSYPARWRGR